MIKRLQPETIIFYGNIPAECKGNIVRIKATTDDLKKAETAVLRMSNDKYRKAIFNAQVYANSGAGTYEKAVDMACRDMLKAELNCVEYKNGARHTLADYADMAIRTANKRAYLMGEGEKRKEWGISLVVVNSRRGGCSDCAKYIGKVFIDDVYSGGKQSDGKYPLLSEAIKKGLFHPRCKDSTSTYYEGITTLKPVTPEEMAEMERREKLEQQHSYYQNQANKNQRVADYSLDTDNQRIYQHRAKQSRKKADEIGKKLDEAVANSGESGIIELERKNAANNRFPASQERIDNLIEFDLKGIKFTSKPIYNPRIRDNGKTTIREFMDGTVKEIVKVEIGKQDKSSAEFLEDTILHEELEARIAVRSKYSKKYRDIYNAKDTDRHNYINKVIERYFKIKGWNYELV